MKSISGAMRTHLDGVVTTLCTVWSITRTDGEVFYLTDHDADVVFGGNTYVASSGYSRTVIATDSSMSVDNVDITGIFNSAEIVEDELQGGLFDYAEVHVSIVNWADPDGTGEIKMRRGWLGEIVVTRQGTYRTELRGLMQALAQRVIETYQPECRADLGDTRCGIAIYPAVLGRNQAVLVGEAYRVATTAGVGQEQYENRVYRVTVAGTTAGSQPSYDTTIGNPTTDGTATLVAEDAFMRDAVVATVTDRRIFTITVTEARAVDDWFNGGGLVFETGDNASGKALEIKDWTQSSSTVELFLAAPFEIQVGDKLRLYAGCDKRLATCKARFANVLNFRGEPYLPGIDDLVRYPDAR